MPTLAELIAKINSLRIVPNNDTVLPDDINKILQCIKDVRDYLPIAQGHYPFNMSYFQAAEQDFSATLPADPVNSYNMYAILAKSPMTILPTHTFAFEHLTFSLGGQGIIIIPEAPQYITPTPPPILPPYLANPQWVDLCLYMAVANLPVGGVYMISSSLALDPFSPTFSMPWAGTVSIPELNSGITDQILTSWESGFSSYFNDDVATSPPSNTQAYIYAFARASFAPSPISQTVRFGVKDISVSIDGYWYNLH